jgi:hypothetical protein
MKCTGFVRLIVQAGLLLPVAALAADVEVTLQDGLDGNLNGYCLDIRGGGRNIDPSQGLQAHTCYSYRGDLGSDQAFDSEGISRGEFKIPAFDVCATMEGSEAGDGVTLTACDESELQRFEFAANGYISPQSAPGMCLTAGRETTFGMGGVSPHQIKNLTLESCADNRAAYQEWTTRTQAEYDSEQGR